MRRVLFALVVVTLGATLLAGCRAEQEIRRAAAFVATAVAPTPTPVPPFDELLRERAAGCSLAGRDAFVAQAERINNAFEDSYLLALSSPRLALTPVVRDMQFFAREMEELEADPCGAIVRDHLLAAYDEAIRVFLTFMRDTPPGSSSPVSMYIAERDLRDSTRLLEAYKLGPEYVLYVDPILRVSSHPHDNTLVTTVDEILTAWANLNRATCTRLKPFQETNMRTTLAAWERFSLDEQDEPPAYLSTPINCDEVAEVSPTPTAPAVAPPPPAGALVWLEFSISAETATEVQAVRFRTPTGETWDLGAVTTPYSGRVQGRPGREIELTGVLPAGGEQVFCQIAMGARVLVRDDGADGRLACRTVIPE